MKDHQYGNQNMATDNPQVPIMYYNTHTMETDAARYRHWQNRASTYYRIQESEE